MSGKSLVEAVDDARVLDPAIRVQEPGADRADALQPRPAHHLAQPARVDHLGVVVEEQQQLLLDHGRGRVVDGGEVEPPGRVGDAQYAVGQRAR